MQQHADFRLSQGRPAGCAVRRLRIDDQSQSAQVGSSAEPAGARRPTRSGSRRHVAVPSRPSRRDRGRESRAHGRVARPARFGSAAGVALVLGGRARRRPATPQTKLELARARLLRRPDTRTLDRRLHAGRRRVATPRERALREFVRDMGPSLAARLHRDGGTMSRSRRSPADRARRLPLRCRRARERRGQPAQPLAGGSLPARRRCDDRGHGVPPPRAARRRAVRLAAQAAGAGRPAVAGAVSRLFRELRPDIVHTRNLAPLEACVPAWLAGVPVRVHGEHGWDVGDLDGSNRAHRFTRRLYRPFVSHYIALSRTSRTTCARGRRCCRPRSRRSTTASTRSASLRAGRVSGADRRLTVQ